MSNNDIEFPLIEEKQFSMSDNIKMSYILSEGAKNLTLVFLHGLGSSKFDFLNVFDYEALNAYKDLIRHLHVPYLKFQCANCGFNPKDLQWQCPQCRKWDTIDFIDSRMMASPSQEQAEKTLSEGPHKKTEDAI